MAKPTTGRRIRSLMAFLGPCLLGLSILFVVTWNDVQRLVISMNRLDAKVDSLLEARSEDEPLPVSPLLLDYQLDVPGRGEVFPAMSVGGAADYWPVAVLRITNTANRPSVQTITAEIPGFSRRTETSLVVGPHEVRQVSIQPELDFRAHQNEEVRNATLEIRAAGPNGSVLYAQSRPVLVHGGSEIYWGRRFANAQIVARWVTPHDPAVLDLISRARGEIRGGRMAGYGSAAGDAKAVARHARAQAEAVFRALSKSGLSYVNSLFVMGDYVNQAQRVRLPRETLHLKTANCMDVSVAFASAMENLGLQPLLIIVPGHAFAGLRLGRDSADILYLDLTVLPDGGFQSAIARAGSWMKKTPTDKVTLVDVAAARVLGVYPLTPDVASTIPASP